MIAGLNIRVRRAAVPDVRALTVSDASLFSVGDYIRISGYYHGLGLYRVLAINANVLTIKRVPWWGALWHRAKVGLLRLCLRVLQRVKGWIP